MWRHFAVLIMGLTVMAFCCAEVSCSRDGFNVYKDMLPRGKFDEMEEEEERMGTKVFSSSPKLHFYLTPSFVQRQDSGGYALGRENLEDNIQTTDVEPVSEGNLKSADLMDKFPLHRSIVQRETDPPYAYSRLNTRTSEDITGLSKRGPGSILTWALSSKRPLTQHSGSGAPTAFIASMGKRAHSLQ